METGQLKAFLKVAELQNMTRAAEQIGLSQSALSRQIGRLEEELGQPLFERQSRQVVLTEAGWKLQKRAWRLVTMLEDLQAELKDDGNKGRLRIGAIPTIAPYFLPDLLRHAADHFPEAQLQVREDVTHSLLKACKQGELDLAFVALPVRERYLEVEELFDEELLLVLPTGHPLANRPTIREADLDAYPFILLAEAHCLSEQVLTYCTRRAINPVSMERTSQLATIQELVALNHGISLVPEMARRIDSSPERVYRSVAGERPDRTIAVVWNSYRYQAHLLNSFLGLTRRWVAAK